MENSQAWFGSENISKPKEDGEDLGLERAGEYGQGWVGVSGFLEGGVAGLRRGSSLQFLLNYSS